MQTKKKTTVWNTYRVRLAEPAKVNTVNKMKKTPLKGRSYKKWTVGVGLRAKPADYDKNPSKYEVQGHDGLEWFTIPVCTWLPNWKYRVRLAPKAQPPEAFDDWVEGWGLSAKPADYDQNPNHYLVQTRCSGDQNWKTDWIAIRTATWTPDALYRVRRVRHAANESPTTRKTRPTRVPMRVPVTRVTITLSDGSPFTGVLDRDGFLLLPRGARPAEPWWSNCEADGQGSGKEPNGSAFDRNSNKELLKCKEWAWTNYLWHRIRPLPGHTWNSILVQFVQRDQNEIDQNTKQPQCVGLSANELSANECTISAPPTPAPEKAPEQSNLAFLLEICTRPEVRNILSRDEVFKIGCIRGQA